jgi:peptidoglycan/xylan/chitin deacetylase (PgdA/CDA1 family)
MNKPMPVLLYHRVGPHDGSFMDDYTVSPGVFAVQMELIRRHGCQPITFESMLRSEPIKKGSQRPLVITFDDGFASNREHAWPVLEKYEYPSATFVVTGRMGQFNTWDGGSRATYPLLSPEDVAAANSEFMTFHSHTETHPNLIMVHDLKTLRRELTQSRRSLNSMVAAPGRVFAYPFGCWNSHIVEEVRNAGYIGACTCMEGLNSARTNPFLLRRVEIREGDTGWRFLLKLWSGRQLLRWPPARLPEISLATKWLRRNLLHTKDEPNDPTYNE